jgi:hypothetical protein
MAGRVKPKGNELTIKDTVYPPTEIPFSDGTMFPGQRFAIDTFNTEPATNEETVIKDGSSEEIMGELGLG